MFRHPYLSLFGLTLLSQLGLPLPGEPILLAAGALSAGGRLGFTPAVVVATLATLLSDLLWYEGGRRGGSRLLRLLCRISLEPDSCVRRTEDLFGQNQARAVLLAKFVPGISSVAAPMAGLLRMNRGRFTLLTLLGSLARTLTFVGLGYVFSERLEEVMAFLTRITGGLALTLGILLALYLLWKVFERWRFVRSLRVLRITPDELKTRLDQGDGLVVVDLRHPLEVQGDPYTIPGAIRMGPEEIQARQGLIPRGRDLVLVCT